jgi:hypothetical protein
MNWEEDLPILTLMKVPRCVKLTIGQKYSLHTFGDACKSSSATVIFLQCEDEGQVSVQLLQAQSRVAPLKKNTTPSLLHWNTLLAFVKEYFWTDSSTVLHWVRKEGHWGAVVGN